MKNHVRFVTSLLLVAIMLSLMLPLTFNSSVAANNVGPAQRQSEQQKPAQQTDLPDQLQPGVFKGEAVRRRVNRLRATNKALNRAMKDKEKVGKTGPVGVERRFRLLRIEEEGHCATQISGHEAYFLRTNSAGDA